jgi:hypothetical protein
VLLVSAIALLQLPGVTGAVSPPVISSEVNSWTATGTGLTALSVSPTTIGDLLAVFIVGSSTATTTVLPTSLSGGGVTTWTEAPNTTVSLTSPTRVGVWWYGVVTATGSATVNLSGTSGSWSSSDRISAIEFTAGSGYTWSIDGSQSNGQSNQSTNPPSSPPFSPSGSGELALYAWQGTSVGDIPGKTTGYDYLDFSGVTGQEFAYNLSVGTATQPTLGALSTTYLVAGILFIATKATTSPPPPPPTTTSPPPPPPTTTSPPPPMLSIHVVGNHLVNGQGQTIRLLGVDYPGMDVLTLPGQCVTSYGQNTNAIDAMLTWDINAVRIPLNEDCWLGINGVNVTTAAAYQASLESLVSELNDHGVYVILDLHRSAPGTIPATAMQVMPDADHSPAFWSSVASRFIKDPAVIFDLFNEPAPGTVLPATADYWACWLSGCTIPVVYTVNSHQTQSSPLSWQAAGMQQLVSAVRTTGATQPIMLSGLDYANGVEGWLTHIPVDPADQLIASVHVYNTASCNTVACWDQWYVPIASHYPVVTAELGEDDCSDGFIDQYMQFADANGISYLGWSWSIETSCSSGEGAALLTDSNGTPSPEGVGLRNHLLALAG